MERAAYQRSRQPDSKSEQSESRSAVWESGKESLHRLEAKVDLVTGKRSKERAARTTFEGAGGGSWHVQFPRKHSMAAEKRIRILAVDDHPLMLDGILFALTSQPDLEVVGTARTGAQAVDLYRSLVPDVTLMDVRMPQTNGIDAIIAIRARYPSARFLVLTTYAGDVQATRALRAGALGYLLKGSMRTDLVRAIREVHAGRRYIPAEIAADMAEHFDADTLTNRELEILRSVAAGSSNKRVAASLGITEETVKGHMRNILLKLDANDRTHAVIIALKRGYLEA